VIPLYMSRSVKNETRSINQRRDIVKGSNSKEAEGEEKTGKTMRAELMESVKSRIAIDNVVTLVNRGAEFSFDYLMLVLVASIIAAVGLVTDNVVLIVASMLVSPLMGKCVYCFMQFDDASISQVPFSLVRLVLL